MKTIKLLVNAKMDGAIQKAGTILDLQDDKKADDAIATGIATGYDRKAAEAEAAKVKSEAAARAKAEKQKQAAAGDAE